MEVFGQLAGWQWSILFMGIAALADFADGFCARLLGAYSELGKQLDSLSDNVSFGVAPALLMFNLLTLTYPDSPAWLPWCALIIPVGGVLRLARFNIDSRQTSEFIGMPIPANAIFWCGYASALAMSIGSSFAIDSSGVLLWYGVLARPAVALPSILIITWLMISDMRMFSLKFKSFGWKGNARRWILILSSLTLIGCFGLPAFSLVIILYVLMSARR